jgi:hypothetical protein
MGAGCWRSRASKRKESSHEKVLVQARGDPYRAYPFVRGRMIQPYDLLTALDLDSLMLFFWFTLLFDLPLHHERRGGNPYQGLIHIHER